MNSTIVSLAGEMKKVAATSGGEFAGACPRCGGTDRFRVWPANGETGRFMCRQCGWTGDGIQFVRDTTGASYKEACAVAGTTPRDSRDKRDMSRPGQAGQAGQAGHVPAVWEPKPSVLPGGKWLTAAEAFVSRAVEAMAASEEGQAYARSRGLTPETIKTLRIGWNPRDVFQDRGAWGLSSEVSQTTGKPRHVWLPSGLVIPTLRDGKVVAVKVRRDKWTPEDRFPKYVCVSGSHAAPMVLSPGQGKPVVVVESELDAILVAQEARDLVTAVAVRTANGKPDNQTFLILSGLVLVALDRDRAGAEAAKWWKTHFPHSKRWIVPFGKDVGDLLATPGLIRAWIEAGLPDPPAEKPKRFVWQAGTLAHGVPCPYSRTELDAFAVSNPDLICCPATHGNPWQWREQTWCQKCKTPCEVGTRDE